MQFWLPRTKEQNFNKSIIKRPISAYFCLCVFPQEIVQPSCTHSLIPLKLLGTGRIGSLNKSPQKTADQISCSYVMIKIQQKQNVLWGVIVTKGEKMPLRKRFSWNSTMLLQVLLKDKPEVSQDKTPNQQWPVDAGWTGSKKLKCRPFEWPKIWRFPSSQVGSYTHMGNRLLPTINQIWLPWNWWVGHQFSCPIYDSQDCKETFYLPRYSLMYILVELKVHSFHLQVNQRLLF